MARPLDSRVEDALRFQGATVASVGNGAWSLSIANGAIVPARAQMSNGWLALRAAIPGSALSRHDDLSWLRVNAYLDGQARVARTLGDPIPHLVADAYIEHEPDLVDHVRSACFDLSGALHAIEQWPDGALSTPEWGPPRVLAVDVERICAEAGWQCVVGEGGSIRLDVETRGVCAARLESSPAGAERAVVELMDLSVLSRTSQRAIAALLMAVGGTVRSVKGALWDRDGAAVAALASPLNAPLDRSLDRSLSALAAACHVSWRETQALRDERLATDYLVLWDAVSRHDSLMTMEETTCL